MDTLEKQKVNLQMNLPTSNNCGNCANWSRYIFSLGTCNLRDGNAFSDLMLIFSSVPEHEKCLTKSKYCCIGHNKRKLFMTENSNNIIRS